MISQPAAAFSGALTASFKNKFCGSEGNGCAKKIQISDLTVYRMSKGQMMSTSESHE